MDKRLKVYSILVFMAITMTLVSAQHAIPLPQGGVSVQDSKISTSTSGLLTFFDEPQTVVFEVLASRSYNGKTFRLTWNRVGEHQSKLRDITSSPPCLLSFLESFFSWNDETSSIYLPTFYGAFFVCLLVHQVMAPVFSSRWFPVAFGEKSGVVKNNWHALRVFTRPWFGTMWLTRKNVLFQVNPRRFRSPDTHRSALCSLLHLEGETQLFWGPCVWMESRGLTSHCDCL